MVEVWTHAAAAPRAIAADARRAEAQGWDGLGVVDSQNRSGDPYVALTMAATVTERIGLATAVTNSITRMAAATAAAIASVDRIAEGRAVLGIGRGDSAVADLGPLYRRSDARPLRPWHGRSNFARSPDSGAQCVT